MARRLLVLIVLAGLVTPMPASRRRPFKVSGESSNERFRVNWGPAGSVWSVL